MSQTTVPNRIVLVYEPHAEESSDEDALAPRMASARRQVIALLDNTKDLADVLLDEAKNVLQKTFPAAEFRYFRKNSVSGAAPELMRLVEECDAVITAVGD